MSPVGPNKRDGDEPQLGDGRADLASYEDLYPLRRSARRSGRGRAAWVTVGPGAQRKVRFDREPEA
jgi:hypothetical protein